MMIKVVLIDNFPLASGLGRYTHTLFNYLMKQREVEPTLILLNPTDTKGLRGKIIFINKRTRRINVFKNYLINPIKIPKGFDLYHITNEWIGIYAKYNKPSVVTFHDPFDEGPGSEFAKRLPSAPRWFSKKFEWSKLYHFFANRSKKVSKHADAIICVSNFIVSFFSYKLYNYGT
jgi:glycosyltransferase involved in cell wall biosynthesis